MMPSADSLPQYDTEPSSPMGSKLRVRFVRAEDRGCGMCGGHVAFAFKIKFGTFSTSISRRYREFVALDRRIRPFMEARAGDVFRNVRTAAQLPGKLLYGSRNSRVVSLRSKSLEQYLESLLCSPMLRINSAFLDFLGLKKAEERETFIRISDEIGTSGPGVLGLHDATKRLSAIPATVVSFPSKESDTMQEDLGVINATVPVPLHFPASSSPMTPPSTSTPPKPPSSQPMPCAQHINQINSILTMGSVISNLTPSGPNTAVSTTPFASSYTAHNFNSSNGSTIPSPSVRSPASSSIPIRSPQGVHSERARMSSRHSLPSPSPTSPSTSPSPSLARFNASSQRAAEAQDDPALENERFCVVTAEYPVDVPDEYLEHYFTPPSTPFPHTPMASSVASSLGNMTPRSVACSPSGSGGLPSAIHEARTTQLHQNRKLSRRFSNFISQKLSFSPTKSPTTHQASPSCPAASPLMASTDINSLPTSHTHTADGSSPASSSPHMTPPALTSSTIPNTPTSSTTTPSTSTPIQHATSSLPPTPTPTQTPTVPVPSRPRAPVSSHNSPTKAITKGPNTHFSQASHSTNTYNNTPNYTSHAHVSSSSSSSLSSSTSSSAAHLCSICLDRATDRIFYPCRHVTCCGECVDVLMTSINACCPQCRQKIMRYDHVFLS